MTHMLHTFGWVAFEELKLSYHNPETILLAVYPYHSNLKSEF